MFFPDFPRLHMKDKIFPDFPDCINPEDTKVFSLLDTFDFFDTFITQNLLLKLDFIASLNTMGHNLLQKSQEHLWLEL